MQAISQSALDLLTHLSLASQIPPVSWEAASHPVTGQSLLVRGSFCRLVYLRTERIYLDRQALQELYSAGLVEQVYVSRTQRGEERVYGRAFGNIVQLDEDGARAYNEAESEEMIRRKTRAPGRVFAGGFRLTEAGSAFLASQATA